MEEVKPLSEYSWANDEGELQSNCFERKKVSLEWSRIAVEWGLKGSSGGAAVVAVVSVVHSWVVAAMARAWEDVKERRKDQTEMR